MMLTSMKAGTVNAKSTLLATSPRHTMSGVGKTGGVAGLKAATT